MKIRAIFDSQFSGEATGSVWIVDSPANRPWFERAKPTLAEGSAVFLASRYESRELAFCYMVWGIQDHFPDWQQIHVSGLDPFFPIPDALKDEGRWEIVRDSLVLHRNSYSSMWEVHLVIKDPDGKHRVEISSSSDGKYFRYSGYVWKTVEEEDLIYYPNGGYWSITDESGYYGSLIECENSARLNIDWLKQDSK